jgi:hypothetical protein
VELPTADVRCALLRRIDGFEQSSIGELDEPAQEIVCARCEINENQPPRSWNTVSIRVIDTAVLEAASERRETS